MRGLRFPQTCLIYLRTLLSLGNGCPRSGILVRGMSGFAPRCSADHYLWIWCRNRPSLVVLPSFTLAICASSMSQDLDESGARELGLALRDVEGRPLTIGPIPDISDNSWAREVREALDAVGAEPAGGSSTTSGRAHRRSRGRDDEEERSRRIRASYESLRLSSRDLARFKRPDPTEVRGLEARCESRDPRLPRADS